MPHIAALNAVRRVVSTRQALDENMSAPCKQSVGEAVLSHQPEPAAVIVEHGVSFHVRGPMAMLVLVQSAHLQRIGLLP
jgi:hypothetical protein